ncbi:hypothetical protein B0H16DRAFT_190933 [Mycena metata]|uniref:Uncharacterized protein n=1 Tax=Mycena metata TaxID=1033252 RepID=A0AAD7JTN3_9AGAR|nr:hypothetical protein B0H16DRAFT_190933 [Mycena metata]
MLSAKSGNDWTRNELSALNIVVQPLEPPAFFGNERLPEPTVDSILLDNLARPDGPMSKEHRLFFRYLEDASHFLESSVSDFTAFLLRLLNFDEPESVVHQRLEIRFVMCGQVVNAKPDAVIMDEKEDYILLVQEDKMSLEEVEPQLIAGAIAAFYENNRRRTANGQSTIASKVFAGIAVSGTGPTLYKIPVSQELLDRISTAQFPPGAEDPALTAIIVSKLVPPVANLDRYTSDGMVPLANRRTVFQCLAAFKQFVDETKV